MRFTVIGIPGNRRVALFAAAARAAGLPPPRVVPWQDVLRGEFALEPATVVRIESPGEDPEVDRALRSADAPAPHGQIQDFGRWYRGFVCALRRLDGRLACTPGAIALNQPRDIEVMFDKRRCHALLDGAGVPVPPALPPVAGYDDLRARLRDAGWSRAFVKPRYGSSASGVVALATAPGRVRATTSVELVWAGAAGVELYNSLRVRTYERERDVAAIVDALAPQGLHVERWLPKAGFGGRVVDLRVVVIAGRPTHVVVRASASPMTNLHLGNQRGDLQRLRAAIGERVFEAAMATCVRVAERFPGTLHVGVDLLLAPGWRRHAVAEVNAFGDLLPGLLASGRDTYAEQVHALMSRSGWLRCAT
jgi:glutathione synthase/RimK-type ligase-like ATP-grasp enzyme